jgi:hypothetical protein
VIWFALVNERYQRARVGQGCDFRFLAL